MSLQTKFAILLTALGAAVLVAFGAAWWSLQISYQEIRGPVESSARVLDQLIGMEKLIDELRALALPGDAFRAAPGPERADTAGAAPIDGAAFRDRMDAVNGLLARVRDDDIWTGFVGKSATVNLTQKIADLNRLGMVRFGPEPADPARGATAHVGETSPALIGGHLFQIHELLKRMEKRVVDDISNLAKSGARLRVRLFVVLGLSLMLVVLTAFLAILLVRRWILLPVSLLRTAAARIAAGDFEHRIPVASAARADEITSLSTEVNHMAGMVKQMQTESVEQARLAAVGEMVRRLAHNLRDPLNGIRGLAELTRMEARELGPAGAAVRESQDRIIHSVDLFGGWLSDLLNVTKPTTIHAQPTDAARWLAGLVEAHGPLAQTRGVGLTLHQESDSAKAVFDPRHLEQAVSAILSNAIDAAANHARPSGTPSVRVVSRVVQNGQPGKTWELSIEDSGPGVPPDLRDSIFKPYFTTKQHGSGIGLAVAQQVVRAHGGQISVEDVEPGPQEAGQTPGSAGARFRIRLPLDRRPAGDIQVASIGHS